MYDLGCDVLINRPILNPRSGGEAHGGVTGKIVAAFLTIFGSLVTDIHYTIVY